MYFPNALNTREDQTVPTTLLVDIMRDVLENNIFEFKKKKFIQLIGTAIGTGGAPTLANIFMAVIDDLIEECGIFEGETLIEFLKRFIDDLLLFWAGTVQQFEDFMLRINSLHPTIKFTSSYNYAEKSTNYLDMEIKIVNGVITTDLYRKPADKIQYLLPSSCHPTHIFDNIPYSLALRIVRICSQKEDQIKRMEELEGMLSVRKYNGNIVKAAIEKAQKLGREKALERVEKKKSDRVTFTVKYHPSLPSISRIVKTHWKTMTRETRLREIFPDPPMVAYQQHSNLRSMLVRAKLPSGNSHRKQTGMRKCRKGCVACSRLKLTNYVKSCRIFLHDCILARNTNTFVPRNIARNS